MFEGETLMVDPEEMQDRRLKVPYVHWILDDIVGKIVSLTVDHAPFDATTCHPEGKAAWMVVAAIIGSGQLAL
jgi:hypothetical protein